MELLNHLTIIDLFAALVVLTSIVSSAIKGFFRSLFGMAAVIVGLVLAGLLYDGFAPYYMPYVKTETIANLLAFVTIFIAVILAKEIIMFLVSKLIKSGRLRWFDKVLGGAFGLIIGWMICATLFLALTAFPVKIESVRNSTLAPYFLFGARMAAAIVPRELKERFHAGYKKVIQFWNEGKG